MAWIGLYHFDDTGTDTVVDVSGNGFDIDLTPADADQVTGGQTGGALGKAGAVMPVLPAGLLAASESDDRSIMFDALGTGRAVWWIRWESDALGSGIWGVLALDGTTLQSRARRQSDSAAAGALTIGTTSAGTWRNACLTYVRSTAVLSVYLDGTLVTSGVPSGWVPGQQLMIGADRINLAEWTGTGPSIDNLRIADHAADATEVAALAGTPVTGGLPDITGDGASTAPPAESAGSGAVVVAGSGQSSSPAATAAGAGGTPVAGVGSSMGAAAVSAAAGATVVAGGGASVAVPAATAGVGTVVVTGTGASVAPAAVSSGTGGEPADDRDITLTAVLAPQGRITSSLGVRRWTTSLEAQP